MKRVKNSNGVEIDYEATVNLMDDDLREELAFEGIGEDEQSFFEAYCARHLEKFGETFELDKANPIY